MTRPRPRRPVHRRAAPVRWGCTEHRTPPGQDCTWCGEQGALFTRAAPCGEPCPACGDSDGTRCTDSTPALDAWSCTTCGAVWTVEVDEHCPATLGAGDRS